LIVPLKIKSIRRCEPADVFDIQVNKNHNFLANGIVVHNCLVFQEQMLLLCHKVAGFPLSECDKVRKSVLKRQGGNPEESLKKAKAMRQQFVDGAIKNGVDEKVADGLWDKILYFLGYAFNKSVIHNTLVSTFDETGMFLGDRYIESIEPGVYVRSRDESSGKATVVRVKALHDHGVLELVEVKLKTGENVKCTWDHKFRTQETGEMLPLWLIAEQKLSIVCDTTQTSEDSRRVE